MPASRCPIRDLITENLFEKMNKEDKMIDALLQEHARLGSGDDEAFLESLERRLDHEDKIQGEDSGSQRAGNRFGWALAFGAGYRLI